MLTKTCRRCGAEKELELFHRQARGLHGRDSICKVCSTLKQAEWRAKNLDKHAANQKAYRARHPERAQASIDTWMAAHPTYERDRSRRRWANPTLRPGLQAAHKKWSQNNAVRVCFISKRYQAMKHAVSARGVTERQIVGLLQYACVYCGRRDVEMTTDHFVPLSRGGAHDIENLVPACKSCNSSKHNKLYSEWMEARRGHSTY